MIITYLRTRIHRIGCALHGLKVLIITQHHAQLHAVATLAVVIAGRVFHLRRWEWVAILLSIGIVWMAEAFNTALEFLGDEISLDHRERIGKAKDLAAAGVLIVAATSVIITLLIFWNHLQKFGFN